MTKNIFKQFVIKNLNHGVAQIIHGGTLP